MWPVEMKGPKWINGGKSALDQAIRPGRKGAGNRAGEMSLLL